MRARRSFGAAAERGEWEMSMAMQMVVRSANLADMAFDMI